MLRYLYIGCLSLVTGAAGLVLLLCIYHMSQGDQQGLVHLGKSAVLFLYGGYRLRAVLRKQYLIYRTWESDTVRRLKQALHLLLLAAFALFLGAAALLSSQETLAQQLALAALVAMTCLFLLIEGINAANREPVYD